MGISLMLEAIQLLSIAFLLALRKLVIRNFFDCLKLFSVKQQ